jgi:hypothetical protein
MRLTPTGAGPDDFAQDEHARDEPADHKGVRTFVMRMDRVEPVREALQRELRRAEDDARAGEPTRDEPDTQSLRRPTLHARGVPAPASPELLRDGMHDPATDSAHEPATEHASDEASGESGFDATMQRVPAERLSNEITQLSPTQMAIKARLIAQVIDANPTASHAFLQAFSPRQLRLYLDSLTLAKEPRGTVKRRGKGSPAIEAYRPSA